MTQGLTRRTFLAAGLCACAAPGHALAQTISSGGRTFRSRAEFEEFGARCGTPPPSMYEQRRGERSIGTLRTRGLAIETRIVIPVHFNVIHNGKDGRLTDDQVDEQMATLNAAYRDSKFDFTPASLRFHDKPEWFGMGHNSQEERAMKEALVQAPDSSLNIYTTDLKGGLLGWATFPWWLEFRPELDGVIIAHASTPGHDEGPFNLGKTAVHEVGHWLGLFHTFQNGCTDPGDSISDTSPEQEAGYGCPRERQSCPGAPARDPVDNFMDYSDDACMSAFTSEQARRMRELTGIFRTKLYQRSAARTTRSFERPPVSSSELKAIREQSY